MLVYIFEVRNRKLHEASEDFTRVVVSLKGRLCDDVKLQSGKGYGRLARRATTPPKLIIHSPTYFYICFAGV